MLPTLASRLIAVFGLICGCAAIYLAGWDPGRHGLWPQALAAATVASLFALRAAPKQLIDEDRLKAAAGKGAVTRLSVWRGIGLVIAVIDLAPGFIAPFISADEIRHGVLIVAATVLLLAFAILATVEARYRVLIRTAGRVDTVGKP